MVACNVRHSHGGHKPEQREKVARAAAVRTLDITSVANRSLKLVVGTYAGAYAPDESGGG
jgi:hypothetical protein